MNIKATQSKLNSIVTELLNAEKTTKGKLGVFSREVIPYVLESQDVGMVNRVITKGALSPANHKVAVKFFTTYLPWEFDKEKGTFGKKKEQGAVAKAKVKLDKELADADWDIWKWHAKENPKSDKPKDHVANVKRALKAGFDEQGDNKLTTAKIASILAELNVPLEKLIPVLQAMSE